MLDFTNASITSISVHHVGNKTHGEGVSFSEAPLNITSGKHRQVLFKMFLKPFSKVSEFYRFTSALNPVSRLTAQIFDLPGDILSKDIHRKSVELAKHLHEVSLHPQIKPGDLFVVYFTGIGIDNIVTDGIGIFKYENKQSFVTLENSSGSFALDFENGINVDKVDKACLILNYGNGEEGFRVCSVDKASKSKESQFWNEGYLQITPCNDDFHATKDFLSLTSGFIKNHLPEEDGYRPVDRIDLLHQTIEYFKVNPELNKEKFVDDVFKDPNTIERFNRFEQEFCELNEMKPSEEFNVSVPAVKQQQKLFKSILKLDANFTIEIHGDKSFIEQGEENGRKFYKFFYQSES